MLEEEKSSIENVCTHMLPYLGGAQVNVGGGGGGGSSWFVGVVGLVKDAPQQSDRRHDGVEDGQDA